jgi:hypothetical protein
VLNRRRVYFTFGAGFQPSILSNAERVSKDAANATNLGRIASFDTASATLQPTQDACSNIRPQTEMLPPTTRTAGAAPYLLYVTYQTRPVICTPLGSGQADLASL